MGIVDNVKREVRNLSVQDRASLAHWIILNLDESDEPQEIVDTTWRAEVRNRIREIRNGKVKMIPSDEMWSDLLKSYAQEN